MLIRRLPRVLASTLVLAGCPAPGIAAAGGFGGLAEERAVVLRASIVGNWAAAVGREEVAVEFRSDGTYQAARTSGTWSVADGELVLEPADGEPITYAVDLMGEQLTISRGDLAQPMVLFARPMGANLVTTWSRWVVPTTPGEMEKRLIRIGTIIGIVVIAGLAVAVLRRVSAFLIFSEWGPFRFIFTRHKTKTRTVHSVALNIIKYLIYFTALGQILAELGINYTAYFASLSVIGLAIGFGSQGLVQDIVTGFFLIFDGQFGVGDLVEISGQSGLVEELGLRTTRLRNYLGQMVVIPNRNIAVVGNFTRGALVAQIDVPVHEQAARAAGTRVDETARELYRQMEGTILKPPGPATVLRLATDETFVRLVVNLWPGQAALIETQVVPRLLRQLEPIGVELTRDRVLVLYRQPETQEVPAFRLPFGRWRKDAAPGGS